MNDAAKRDARIMPVNRRGRKAGVGADARSAPAESKVGSALRGAAVRRVWLGALSVRAGGLGEAALPMERR